MHDLAVILAAAVAAYLIGSINFSVIISKAISGKDIRESGSGNAGATNMLRTHGKKMGVLILILDVLKGVTATLIAFLLKNSILEDNAFALNLPYIIGVCVALGHNFPVFFGFKGGKGVATSLGVILVIDWQIGLVVAVVSIGLMAATGFVSLGSITGALLFIIAEIVRLSILGTITPIVVVCIFILGSLLIIRHHANIKRLINKTENSLYKKKGE